MLPATSTAAFGGHRALFHTPPRGTCSRVISLRLHRRSRATTHINIGSFLRCQNIHPSIRGFATAVESTNAVSDREFALFNTLMTQLKSPNKISPHNTVSTNRNLDMAGADVGKPLTGDLAKQLPSPIQKGLEALRQRDTRRLLIYLGKICLMGELELQEAVAALPRTTITEFLRSLDPLRVARDADPTDKAHIQVGMYQTLHLESVVDDWGVRKLYSQLLQCMLALVVALKASGQVLQTEEYIYLLRCAGAASDPVGARWIWNDMVRTQNADWRQSETYAEYISARFLTRPIYTSYDKTRRLVHPRNLHRSRIRLDTRYVYALDRLRFNQRIARLYKGLLKDVPYAEDIMRKMRKNRPVTNLFYKLMSDGHFITEPLLCSLIVGFGRAGSLRFIGSRILHAYFGIDMRRLTYNESLGTETTYDENGIRSHACRVRPTLRLMEAVVEAYGSNGEIAVALQLVDHISRTFSIPIPRSIWQDLLEWTYIMGSPAVSVAWKKANMQFKIPNPAAIKLIWDAMISHHVQPGFEQYNILIRNLLGRHQFGKVMPFIRQAVDLYDAQCQEYEAAVLEYVRMIRDGVRFSNGVHRYERARFRKAQMWYDIRVWCRAYLLGVRSYNPSNPLTIIAVPDFINEFRRFIPNPAQYRTATGYISLFDPAWERLHGISVSHVPMAIPMKLKRKRVWGHQFVKARKLSVFSSHSLVGHVPVAKLGLVTLLTSTARTLEPSGRPSQFWGGNVKKSRSLTESLYSDDDDDYF
ncbi:hypothetical protein F5Y06DRAFT_278725 [Hypoxylon sp. FL0890]|nr:hypothetical protein F5Y06DRAFT_278725 [Hypoxylon sp. FL0890]